jgi:predicted SnoaL-like aldol condensation-catalyzing enzyme
VAKKSLILVATAMASLFLVVSAQPIGRTMTNKEIVLDLIVNGLSKADAAVVSRHVAENMIQHNPMAADGLAGLLGLIKALPAPMKYDVRRVIGEGDFVMIHSKIEFAGQVNAVFDVFRLKNGKIVEHWDSMQPNPDAKNPSGRTLLDGSITVVDHAKTDINKAVIQDFYNLVFIGGAFDKIGNYYNGNDYIQHNPGVADGLSNLLAVAAEGAKTGKPLKVEKVSLLFAEGNFVYVRSGGEFGGQKVVFSDLYRLQNNKIAEHWDVIQPIPEKSANNNGML